MQETSVLTISPSFSRYSTLGSTKVTQEFSHQMEDFGLEPIRKETPIQRYYTFSLNEPEDLQQKQQVVVVEKAAGKAVEEEEGFEFHSFCKDNEALTISADEIFSNGQILPLFRTHSQGHLHEEEGKVFNKTCSPRHPRHLSLVDLMKDEHESSSETKSQDQNPEVLPGTFCLWRPNPNEMQEKCKKSGSVGSSKRWRLKDLISRSSSNGKETLGMFASSSKKRDSIKIDDNSEVSGENSTGKHMKNAGEGEKSAHEIHYIRNRELNKVDRRRSYLPYKKDIIGFFANVNGLTKQVNTF